MLVDATVDGTLNLANISKAYPVELDTELSGTLNAKLHTVFDMNAIETNAYERTQNNGTIAVSDFRFFLGGIGEPSSYFKCRCSIQAWHGDTSVVCCHNG